MTSGTTWMLGIGGAAVVAWGGFFIHNVADLPEQTILSAGSLYPTLIWVTLLALWLIPATRPAGARTLLVWALVNAVGGVISVLPFGFLPYQPAQTLAHYGFHLLYFGTQLPLILLLGAWLRRRAQSRTPAVPDQAVR